MADNEIRRDASGALDEVVAADVHFHLEQMTKRSWWIGLSRGRDVCHIWIRASKKGKLTVNVSEDSLGLTEVVTDMLTPADIDFTAHLRADDLLWATAEQAPPPE